MMTRSCDVTGALNNNCETPGVTLLRDERYLYTADDERIATIDVLGDLPPENGSS